MLDPGSQSEVSSCLRVTSGVTESRSSLLDLGTSRMDGADISKQIKKIYKGERKANKDQTKQYLIFENTPQSAVAVAAVFI